MSGERMPTEIKRTRSSLEGLFAKKLYYIRRWKRQNVLDPSRVRLITFRRYARLLSSMSKPSFLILDFGCDSGVFARMLESEGQKNLVGVELASRFKRGQNISFIVAESTHFPFRRKAFDMIFARKFVSIQDVKESLRTFHEILKDDGKLFIEVPNVKRLKSRIYEALGLTPPYPPKYFPHLHMAPFKKILQDAEFCPLRIEGDHVSIPLIGNILSLLRLDKLQKVLGQSSPTLCLHLLSICRKQLIAH